MAEWKDNFWQFRRSPHPVTIVALLFMSMGYREIHFKKVEIICELRSPHVSHHLLVGTSCAPLRPAPLTLLSKCPKSSCSVACSLPFPKGGQSPNRLLPQS